MKTFCDKILGFALTRLRERKEVKLELAKIGISESAKEIANLISTQVENDIPLNNELKVQ